MWAEVGTNNYFVFIKPMKKEYHRLVDKFVLFCIYILGALGCSTLAPECLLKKLEEEPEFLIFL